MPVGPRHTERWGRPMTILALKPREACNCGGEQYSPLQNHFKLDPR